MAEQDRIEIIGFHGSPGSPKEFAPLTRQLGLPIFTTARRGYPLWIERERSNPGSQLSLLSSGRKIYLGHGWGGVECLLDSGLLLPQGGVCGILLVSPELFPAEGAKFSRAWRRTLVRTPIVGDWLAQHGLDHRVEDLLTRTAKPFPVPPEYRQAARLFRHPEAFRTSVLERRVPTADILTRLRLLDALRIPVALVWGEEDASVGRGPSDYSRIQLDPIRESVKSLVEYRIPGAGHAIPWTHPRDLARFVQKFLNRISRSEAS